MFSLNVRISMQALMLLTVLQLLAISNCEGIKRVPHGFVGMRGKKYFDYGDTGPYDKRGQGFVGVKGKKDLLTYLINSYDPYGLYKRTPTGFVGMRGKKYDPYEISSEFVPKRGSILGQIDYASGEDVESDFSILDDLIRQNIANRQEEIEFHKNASGENSLEDSKSNELTKRAAQMNQFFGMRGKKSDGTNYSGHKRPFDVSFRGKFVGVRGKKNIGAFDDHDRQNANDFIGINGKKETLAQESSNY